MMMAQTHDPKLAELVEAYNDACENEDGAAVVTATAALQEYGAYTWTDPDSGETHWRIEVNVPDGQVESAVIAQLRLDARAEGRADAAVTIRQMMADILPAVLVSGTVADGIGIEQTLRNIRATFDQQCKDIESLKQSHQVLAQAMDFTATELDLVAADGYSHAQKNGVVRHIAARLRQWAGRRPMRAIVPPEPFNTDPYDPNYIPF